MPSFLAGITKVFSVFQEVENHVGEELCRLFAEDADVEWSTVLRRSKESARRIQQANGGVRPRGPMAPLQLQQQQHHHQQQPQQQQGGRRGFRDRNRSRGGFGSGRSGTSDNHDMGRYTTQINQKRLHTSIRTFSVLCASPTLRRWLVRSGPGFQVS